LSDESDKAGHRISRTSIHELETGKRKSISTAELSVLAWALKVPPVQLLYPDMPDGEVEIVPEVEKPSIEAVQWFSGELADMRKPTESASADDMISDVKGAHEGVRLVRLARDRLAEQTRIEMLSRAAARAKGGDVKNILAEIALCEQRVDIINAELRLIDGAVVVGNGG